MKHRNSKSLIDEITTKVFRDRVPEEAGRPDIDLSTFSALESCPGDWGAPCTVSNRPGWDGHIVMDTTHSPSRLFGPLVSLDDVDDDRPTFSNESLAETEVHAVPTSLPVIDHLPRTYICPGEKHPIPRSIHLARLAAFYPNCRLCEHRADTGQLPRSMIGRIEQTAQRGERPTPFLADGIRGAYLNHLTRKMAGQIAAAFAEHLWEHQPLTGRPRPTDDEPDSSPTPQRRRSGPTIVIGQDARPSSPNLSVGVSESLRLMGCNVVDIGRVSGPCLTFTVDHLQASGGLFVTGSGCPQSWTGLDAIGPGGIPFSLDGTLADVRRRFEQGVSRPTRQGGTQRYFDASVPYRASLLKHFQDVAARKVVCLCTESTIVETLTPLLEPLPCEVHWITDPSAVKGERLLVVKQGAADAGIVISDDGMSLRWYDRNGRLMPPAELRRRIVSATGALDALTTEDGSRPSDECVARSMQQQSTSVNMQSDGRFWYRDSFPRCDAAITLGHLLRRAG